VLATPGWSDFDQVGDPAHPLDPGGDGLGLLLQEVRGEAAEEPHVPPMDVARHVPQRQVTTAVKLAQDLDADVRPPGVCRVGQAFGIRGGAFQPVHGADSWCARDGRSIGGLAAAAITAKGA